MTLDRPDFINMNYEKLMKYGSAVVAMPPFAGDTLSPSQRASTGTMANWKGIGRSDSMMRDGPYFEILVRQGDQNLPRRHMTSLKNHRTLSGSLAPKSAEWTRQDLFPLYAAGRVAEQRHEVTTN